MVRIIEPGDNYECDPRFHWRVESLSGPLAYLVCEDGWWTGEIDYAMTSDFADDDLRPLRYNDGEDETLSWAEQAAGGDRTISLTSQRAAPTLETSLS